MRIISIYLSLLFIVLFTGCSNVDKVQAVNAIANSQWRSHTDKVSRNIAYNSQKKFAKHNQNYYLGANDVLQIQIFDWGKETSPINLRVRVPEDGAIEVGPLQPLVVIGKDLSQVRSYLKQELLKSGSFVTPEVNIIIEDFRGQVSVTGAVENPGTYPLKRNVATLLDILTTAGGLKAEASYRIYILKNSPVSLSSPNTENKMAAKNITVEDNRKVVIDMYELLELGNLELNMVLENGDIVYVPNAEEFAVTGFVKNAGNFPLKSPTTVLQAVAIAGGVIEGKGSPELSFLKRRNNKGKEEIVPVDLLAIAKKQLPDIFLQANDVLIVGQSWGKFLYNEFKDLFNLGVNPLNY